MVVSVEKSTWRIRELGVSGEILSGDNVASEYFKTKLEKFVSDEGLMPCLIFNADETGLNYKMLPKKKNISLKTRFCSQRT